MSKYVISDLHGCYDKFINMLKLIKFKSSDKLYILGDVFDRGEKSLEIIDYIIPRKNITLIKGNHEQMYINFYEGNDTSLWYYNGGKKTHNELLQREPIYADSLYKYLKKLPFVKVVDNFILVHAGLYFPDNYDYMDIKDFIKQQEEDICLWDRSNIGNERRFKDYTIICGHTPVQMIKNRHVDAKIIERCGTYYIDCGCVFEKANGKLACLRLDDMEEFYIT